VFLCPDLTPDLCWSKWQKKSQTWPPINKYNSKGRKSLYPEKYDILEPHLAW